MTRSLPLGAHITALSRRFESVGNCPEVSYPNSGDGCVPSKKFHQRKETSVDENSDPVREPAAEGATKDGPSRSGTNPLLGTGSDTPLFLQ